MFQSIQTIRLRIHCLIRYKQRTKNYIINYMNTKLDIKIPQSWQDVTVNQFIELAKLDDEEDNLKRISKLIFILIPELINYDLEDMTSESFVGLINNMEFLQEKPEQKELKEIKIGKDIYYPFKDFKNLTVGEMVSFELVAQKEKLTLYDSIPLSLAILLRKENEEFDSDMIYERIKLFGNNVSILDVYGFFLSSQIIKQTSI